MSQQCKRIISLLATSAVLTGLYSQPVLAAGFALLEQGGRLLGNAYAGTAASADDATIGYYNSAGLTHLGQEQIAFSLVGVFPHSKLNVTSATPNFTTVPRGGRNVVIPRSVSNLAPGSVRTREPSAIPGLHYARRINDCLVFGLNLAMPFGLDIGYPIDSISRYLSTRSSIQTYDISPSLGISLGNGLSIGGGVDFIYNIARIDTRIGYGYAPFDGWVENTVSRWGIAGHVGAFWELSECTRLGLQYRSGYKVRGRGISTLTTPIIPTPIGNVGGVQVVQGIHANFRMPGSVVLSGYTDVTDQWALLADIQWTNWNKFNRVYAVFDDQTVLIQKFNLKNSMRYALGTNYQFTECWLGRMGVAFDKSAVRDFYRTTNIPDSNRYWLAFGAQYRFSECLSLDIGYAHLFFKKAYLDQGPPVWTKFPAAHQRLNGRYRSHADLIGVQLTWEIA